MGGGFYKSPPLYYVNFYSAVVQSINTLIVFLLVISLR